MTARIFCSYKNATQSVQTKRSWVLVYEPSSPKCLEPLMGYTSSRDEKSQLKLKFFTLEEAKFYADSLGIEYRVEKLNPANRPNISYENNFSFNRFQPWTH